jgi:hypothetical protein
LLPKQGYGFFDPRLAQGQKQQKKGNFHFVIENISLATRSPIQLISGRRLDCFFCLPKKGGALDVMITATKRLPKRAKNNCPPPEATPTAADNHTLAAVVKPLTSRGEFGSPFDACRQITPAPIKPTPDGMACIIRWECK